MAKSASKNIEDAIKVKWLSRKLRARGMWLTLRTLAEDATPLGAVPLGEFSKHKSALRQLEAVGLVRVEGGQIVLPHIQALVSLGRPLTKNEWSERMDYFCGACAYCHHRSQPLQQEHMLPTSRGGELGGENVVPACAKCNRNKSTLTVLEFVTGFHLSRRGGQRARSL